MLDQKRTCVVYPGILNMIWRIHLIENKRPQKEDIFKRKCSSPALHIKGNLISQLRMFFPVRIFADLQPYISFMLSKYIYEKLTYANL